MRDCNCYPSFNNIALDPFRVSSHLTILRCTKCGGKVAEWIDKITPTKKAFDPEIQRLFV